MNEESIIFSQLAQLQGKQKEAWYTILDPLSKYILYGGAAGGGKSYLLRWCAVGLAMYYYAKYGIERVPIGLFSEDYPTLRDRQVTKIMREFPPWLGTLKETNRDGLAFYLSPRYGSGVIMLRNLDDPSKYASVEFAAILVEELTKNTWDKFEDLRTRMRFPGIEDRKFVGATNPGQIGHGWVKRLWVKPDMDDPDFEQNRFKFIQALYSDNKYNPTDYGDQLKAIKDPQKRKALLDGDWDVFAGQYFEEWRGNLHVTRGFIPAPKSLIVGGMDWGRSGRPSHKGAFYAGFDVVEKVFYKDISFYRCKTFLEVYGKGKTPAEWDREIQKQLRDFGVTLDDVSWVRLDPAAFTKMQDMSLSVADQFGESDSRWKSKLQPASNDRIGGWELIHKWLSIAPDGLPYWQVAENCVDTIRTIPELIYDENRVEDLDTEGEDHPADGQRYMKKHLRWIDAMSGAISTDVQTVRSGNRPLIIKDGKQVALDLDKFARDPFANAGTTRVISSQ